MEKVPALLILALLAWGYWYLWRCIRTGEAPGPPFGIYRADLPVVFWFLVVTFAIGLTFGTYAAILLARND